MTCVDNIAIYDESTLPHLDYHIDYGHYILVAAQKVVALHNAPSEPLKKTNFIINL